MEIFVNPRKGSNNATGKAPKRAFQTIERALQEGLKSGDTLYLMQGETFIPVAPATPKDQPMPFVFKMNGVRVTSYNTGRDSDPAPIIDWRQTDAKDKRGAITLMGSDNTIENIDTRNALRHVVILPGDDKSKTVYSGNTLHNMTCTDWALGVVDYANDTTMTQIHLVNGRMLRDEGKSSDVGASAITLWREAGYEHKGTRISRCTAEDAYALKKLGGFDGSFIEIFGGVVDVDVIHCKAENVGVFVEVGGTTSRHETASNILFQRNVCVNSFGKVIYVNNPLEDYYVDWMGFHFDRNVFKADDVSGVSPVFVQGEQKDMGKRLRMTGNTIVSQAAIYNGGTGTKMDEINRSANTYWRTDGHDDVGIPLINGDVFEDPHLDL